MIRDFERTIADEIDRMYAGGFPQVVHADLHWGNVKVYRGRLHPLDFEDLAWAYPIQDIAISLFYNLGNRRFAAFRDSFQSGYESIQRWPEHYPGQLDTLIVHRGLDLFNYLLTANFPGREHWFPAFIDNIHGRYQKMISVYSR